MGQLRPFDRNSINTSEAIARERIELYERFGKEFGLSNWTNFQPHVSLGYFGNKQKAEDFKSRQDLWTEILREQLETLIISFSRISLYGFTDMQTFFKVP